MTVTSLSLLSGAVSIHINITLRNISPVFLRVSETRYIFSFSSNASFDFTRKLKRIIFILTESENQLEKVNFDVGT